MSERPSSSTTTAPGPEDSSPGASGADAQPQGAALPGARTPDEPPQAEPRAAGKTRDPADTPDPAETLDAAVLIQDDGWTRDLPAAGELARRATLAAWTALPDGTRPDAPAGAEVSVVLADDATVWDLNGAYRGQDKPTNVLSFANLDDTHAPGPPGGEPLLLGDVVLARETVLAEAQTQGKAPGDHLSHLCVHGLLHLLGYDHMAEAEAEAMETLERRVLAGLGIADPYAGEAAEIGAEPAPAPQAGAGGRS